MAVIVHSRRNLNLTCKIFKKSAVIIFIIIIIIIIIINYLLL